MIHTPFSAISSSEAAVPSPRPQPSPQSSADTTAIENIETIKKRLGDAIDRRYSPDKDKVTARKKKLRLAMMIAKENRMRRSCRRSSAQQCARTMPLS